MKFILRQAWREIRNSRSFCFFYSINLALGLTGFILVDTFRHSIEEKISNESKELLGADLALRARRIITDQELAQARRTLPAETREAKAVDFFSMAAGPTGKSRLVKVFAIDPGFPFYGSIKLKLGGDLSGDKTGLLHKQKHAWIYPETRAQLGADLGEEIQLGETKFIIADFIEEETGLSFQPTDLAPKVFISKNYLDETKLLGEGSLAFYTHLFKLPDYADANIFGQGLAKAIDSPEIRSYTHREAGHRAGRLLRYLSDFLSLVSLVALFLACLGSGFLFHGFFTHRMPEISTLISLGTTRKTTLRIFVIQLILLGIFASVPAILACSVFLPAISSMLSGFGTTKIEVFFSLPSILLTLGVATGAGWLLALPALCKVGRFSPSELFQESVRPGTISSRVTLLYSLPGLSVFWGLCIAQTHSDKLANIFFGCFLGSLVLLYLFARFGFKLGEHLFRETRFPIRLAVRSLSRNPSGALTGFLAIGLGVLLLTLIPQTHHGLAEEIGLDDPSTNLPSLFLFDLQEDQLADVEVLLKDQNIQLRNITPWVRGKIKTIRGLPYEKSNRLEKNFNNPDEQRRNAFRNRSFNLSYRDHFLESEQLLAGRPFSGNYDPLSDKPAEISVEHKYAKALDLRLGDQMGIEVAGTTINTIVVNLRRVRWTSFQPNFFVQMQPGVLDQAPKTFLGTIHHLSPQNKERVQNLLVREFPTVSILDVERTGAKILQVVGQMTWSLQLMATLSVFAGLVILFCVVREKSRSQSWEINLQKILGSTSKQIRGQIWFEFGILGGSAAIIGTLLSLLTSYLLAVEVFDRVWSFRWDLPLIVVMVVVGLSILTADLAARKVLQSKPARLLQEG